MDELKKPLLKNCSRSIIFGTYIPIESKLLSREERMKVLSALMFAMEKRGGKVKARKCAVSSK